MQTGWESCPELDVAGKGGRESSTAQAGSGLYQPLFISLLDINSTTPLSKPSREKKWLLRELMASLQSFCVRVWFSPVFTQSHFYPSIPLAPVGKELTPGKSLLGRLRAKNREDAARERKYN